MQVIQNGQWYMSTDERCGAWSVDSELPTVAQMVNANLVRSWFISKGWTLEAICGMIGCMQGESTINPAYVQATNRHRLPNGGHSLNDVPNIIMQNFYMEYYQDIRKAYGIGLVQWDGYSNRNNLKRQKLVAYAMDNNISWWDGWSQMYRLDGEQKYDVQYQTTAFFKPVTYSGTTYTFANYPYSTASPETLAAAWTSGYERNAGGVGFRGTNARWWYNWFNGPDSYPIMPPEDFDDPAWSDPLDPPFNPDDPVPPDPAAVDTLPAWILYLMRNTRKGGKRPCRKI